MAARSLSWSAGKVLLLGGTALSVAALAGCPLYSDNGHGGPTTKTYTTSYTTTTSGGGGAGGSGATGGGGAGGGTGGSAPLSCLADTLHSDVFTIAEQGLCLVGKYTAPIEVGYALSPRWGRHGGPITVQPGVAPNTADVTRWTLPSGVQEGALVAQTGSVPLDIQTSGNVFLGPAAVDLPFANWTLVSWTGDFGGTEGEALLLSGSAVAQRMPASGFYMAAGLPSQSFVGRILHTSLTKIGAPTDVPQAGLYAADICANLQACNAHAVATWGEANGPLTLDQDGNAFAVQTTISPATMALRAFPAASVAPGSGPDAGSELFTLPGFGSELAAVSPSGGVQAPSPGMLFFQPFDAATFDALDVVVEHYIASGGLVGAVGTPTTAFTLTTPGTLVTLTADTNGNLWLGAVTAPGETTFYVIARQPS